MFFLVKLLEESGSDGPRHFDAHAYRTEGAEGVWDFARGRMRTYLILKRKARQFAEHREIQDLLAEIRGHAEPMPVCSRAAAQELAGRSVDRRALASRRLPYERLDQWLVDLVHGAEG